MGSVGLYGGGVGAAEGAAAHRAGLEEGGAGGQDVHPWHVTCGDSGGLWGTYTGSGGGYGGATGALKGLYGVSMGLYGGLQGSMGLYGVSTGLYGCV